MTRVSFLVLLVASIVCTSINAFAAQMKYSFGFSVGLSTFDGATLANDAKATIDLYGDTVDIMGEPNEDHSIAFLRGDLTVSSIGSFALTDMWTVSAIQTLGMVLETAGVPGGAFVGLNVPSVDGRNLYIEQSFISTEPGWLVSSEREIRTSGGSLVLASNDGVEIHYVASQVPLPSTIFLLSSGFTLLIGFRRKFKKA